MDGSVKNIILTADYQERGSTDYQNLRTDVIVQFEDGDKYVAAFISCKSLENTIHESFEADKPYKVLDYILIKDFNGGDIRPIIEAMLAEGDFQVCFRKM
jgi:hypothetical protein